MALPEIEPQQLWRRVLNQSYRLYLGGNIQYHKTLQAATVPTKTVLTVAAVILLRSSFLSTVKTALDRMSIDRPGRFINPFTEYRM